MDPNNEIQTLSLNGNQLALSGANSQDLSGINTDNQTLSLNGNQLSISGGNTQDLSSLNTDSQTLILAGTQLSISGGNSQDLAPLQDNLGNHTATQNVQLGSYFLSGDGDSEGIYISNSGDVGIGTSTPGSFRLNVEGAIQFGGFNTTDQNEVFKAVWLQDPATNWDEYLLKVASTQGSGMFNRPGFGIHMDGTKQFGFWSSGFNQLFTVNGGSGDTYIKGSVGIGTTSPGFKLQVGENADGTVARANAWTTWSDSTLKRDFEELPDALEMLSHINGYYYHWKEGTADSSRQVGVMAQEIERVLPELISTDAEGIMAVDYDKLTALLIEVNQAQEAQITSQQSEIDALKAQLQHQQAIQVQVESAFEARLQALEAALIQP